MERDLDWSAYALADLEPPLARHSRFWLATRDGEGRAALLVHAPPEFTVVEATGEAEGVAALLATAELPRETSIIAWLEHRRVIEARYRSEHWDLMWRMALGPGMVRLPEGGDRARRLGPADLSALQALYAARDSFAPFSAAMLESGVYYGVQHDGRLIAAAGTHVVARASRVAAIGNVYTAPAARGRGLARLTTGAVARALLADGCRAIVLNVKADNAAAIAVYQRLGFIKVRDFWEAPHAERRGVSA